MKRLHRNSKKVHRGENGVFGDKNGIPHHTDPFDEVAFLADYDALTTLQWRISKVFLYVFLM